MAKRGRPSKAELERRRLAELEAQQSEQSQEEVEQPQEVQTTVEPSTEPELESKLGISITDDMIEPEEEETSEPEDVIPSQSEDSTETKITEQLKTYRTRKELPRNMLVPVVSFYMGGCKYTSPRTGASWRFSEFGAIDEIELSELITMKSSKPKYLNVPWLVILDDDVVEFLGLQQLYSKLIKPKDIDKFFKLRSEKMREILTNAPKGLKQLITARAQKLIDSGNKLMDSNSKRSVIEQTCNVDLS